jgi:predicted metal-dependent hydrolase
VTMILGDIQIELIQKEIKNLHLSVLPPDGRVRISAPLHLNKQTIRLYAISKLPWIRDQQQKLRKQQRESPRVFLNKETHYFQGRKYLLRIIDQETAPKVAINGKHLDLYVRKNAGKKGCQHTLNEWYRNELKTLLPMYIQKWEKKIPVKVAEFGVKHMRTKWGTCNIEARRIWLNLELAKKPLRCLEYILVHEMVHLLERRHNERFKACLDKFLPQWRQLRDELNSLPLSHPDWGY